MSYDVTFKVKVEGVADYVEVGDCDANITSNVKEMLDKLTGINWEEPKVGYCKDVMPLIESGYQKLKNNPNAYTKYNAANGWGTTDGVMTFLSKILIAWSDLQEYQPAYAKVAYFFIE